MWSSLLVFICLVCSSLSYYQNDGLDRLYGKPEHACSAEGGLCILATECVEESKAATGLCPSQKSKGFECCYGVPKSETRCQKLGGGCMSKGSCSRQIILSKATDCPEKTECCLLITK